MIQKLHDAIVEIGNEPSFRQKRLIDIGIVPVFDTTAHFADYLKVQRDNGRKLISELGYQPRQGLLLDLQIELADQRAHRASSRSISLTYSSGVDGSGSPPSAAMRARTSGVSMPARSARFSRSTIAFGVPAVASKP